MFTAEYNHTLYFFFLAGHHAPPPGPAKKRNPPLAGRRTFPKYAFGTFESWYKKQVKEQLAFPKQVSYFHGCYVNYNYPQLGKDLVKVMNALGIGVRLLEKEKCCGVALISNGFIKQARKHTSSISGWPGW